MSTSALLTFLEACDDSPEAVIQRIAPSYQAWMEDGRGGALSFAESWADLQGRACGDTGQEAQGDPLHHVEDHPHCTRSLDQTKDATEAEHAQDRNC